jgi:NAD(P)-dependent dehydrogenase (short-subunit alcohol dehydrogenase family)
LFPETALVTGGASGIGAAVVEKLRAGGTDVRVLDIADGFDVSDASAWDSVGTAELAVLNAGIGTGEGDMRELTDERYRRIVGTNVDGVVFGVRRLARVMPAGGAIVVTASLAGLTTMFADPIYSGTKHFLVGFVRSVAPQLAERGIRISAVCPGIVDTPLLGSLRQRTLDAGIELMRPEEIADAVLSAARDEASGQIWTCLPGRAPARHEFPRFFDSA